MNFTNKVILLTVAASDIGTATAVRFSELSVKLAIVDIDDKGLKNTVVGDISKPEDLECVAKSTIKNFKQLNVLVNNVGIMEYGTIENTCLEHFLTLLLLPELLKTKGNIVNTSSICGMHSFPNTLAYNISKAVVDQFTRCVALELGERGVRCNCINPGVIYSNLQKRYLGEDGYKKFIK
ncbi:unnamed protein product [Ceratitis capitata]|uniref:(Mediterranean fruit fly) hypothetical protein n=1 Tax=Ceratitis capitata TaxID=7213 RepID=A0A811TYA3_CERCA|nr:unnamed protein product [Ceratitis capitata]